MEKEAISHKATLEVAEAKFTIDGYEEIFSEFDPRPLSERGLASDFFFELERAIMSKPVEKIDFLMMIPEDKRDLKKEKIIRERLKDYFKRHYEIMKKEKKKIVNKGAAFVISGLILMLAATLLLYNFKDHGILITFLIVLLEPGGWFLFWKGLELAFFDANEAVPNLKFYKRMSNANIRFDSA